MGIVAKSHGTSIGIVFLSFSYAIALFQRTALSEVGPVLAHDFGLAPADLAGLAAVFFWVYLSLQLPAGLLVDALGPRRMAVVGGALSALGCVLFAWADSGFDLILGRMVISAGSSVAFVSLIRYITLRCPHEVATLSGRGIMIANLGAIASGAPLAFALAHVPWRSLWLALAAFSALMSVGLWFLAVETHRRIHPRTRLRHALPELLGVLSCPWTYVGVAVLAGLSGSYYALAGLYAGPILAAAGIPHGIASLEISGLIAGYALGAAFWGWIGDRASNRGAALMLAIIGASLCWAAIAWGGHLGMGGFAMLFGALGFFSGAFVLVFSLVTEGHAPEHAGAAVAAVNCGIPLGAGLCQTLAGHLEGSHLLLPMLGGSLLALCGTLLLLFEQNRRLSVSANMVATA